MSLNKTTPEIKLSKNLHDKGAHYNAPLPLSNNSAGEIRIHIPEYIGIPVYCAKQIDYPECRKSRLPTPRPAG